MDSSLLNMVSDELIHFQSVGRSVGGWLVLDGLTHMSGASSGMPRSSFLHMLSHLQGRWPMFSHLGGELQEVIMQAASERLGHGSPTVLLLPCYTGQTESQGQPRFKG